MRNNLMLVIDGSSMLSTAYFATIPNEMKFAKEKEEKEKYYYKLMQCNGRYTNACYGFLKQFLELLIYYRPKYVAVCWDEGRSNTFRRRLYQDYKAQRKESDYPLKEQFKTIREILEELNIKQLSDKNFEADDFAGTLAHKFCNELDVILCSKDQDYLQLVNNNVGLLMPLSNEKYQEVKIFTNDIKKKYTDHRTSFLFYPEETERYYGIKPIQIIDLKSIAGDKSDNIPGIKGVSDITATKLLAKYKTVEEIFDAIPEDKKELKKLVEELKEELDISRNPFGPFLKEDAKSIALLSKELATIKTDIDLPFNKEYFELHINGNGLKNVINKYQFKSLINYLENNKKRD